MRIAAGRDLADVPDDGTAGVEVGRADEEDAALGMLGGDGLGSCARRPRSVPTTWSSAR